ncbi:MAG: response regulator [Nitrospirae bacterium]|nr:response regulator [Nitrospirota bacterium]
MLKKKILVVDDDAGLTRMLKRNLEATGKYEVREENAGARALSAAKEFIPNLILLDVMMPGIDGGSVAAQIGDDAALKHTPVVFLTAIVRKEEVGPEGSSIAGRTFLAKPVRLEDLTACIERELGKR